ncbi:hypothetical protein Kuja_0100 [Vibrio phage vB_VchM_Kuja]|uniref:ParB/Sulfiredoxin domain-containing protein n=1 Tax=Vibrio phage vB_VchM_Kuja TaxID=2686437 RepID=A0A6B9J587_9CAUD|nr:hypothetical protein HWC83_gp010 [Vibrio phage vB_VchM_Kuja]QGZ16001.1 hypothetical protein Kuja_0100 [Vibrio phage vB_VchM_Kuja]
MGVFSSISDFNTIINGLYIPGGNLAISRSQMPQIDDQEHFKNVLKLKGVSFEIVDVNSTELRLTQNEVDKWKVFKMMREIRRKGVGAFDPVVSGNDKYVLDGSHRFLARLNLSRRSKVKTLKVDMKTQDLIELINNNWGDFKLKRRNLLGKHL